MAEEPLGLPDGFEWVTLDIDLDRDINLIVQLLKNHYISDDEGIFRFDYPAEFMKWALCIPGCNKNWHVGVRAVGK